MKNICIRFIKSVNIFADFSFISLFPPIFGCRPLLVDMIFILLLVSVYKYLNDLRIWTLRPTSINTEKNDRIKTSKEATNIFRINCTHAIHQTRNHTKQNQNCKRFKIIRMNDGDLNFWSYDLQKYWKLIIKV